MRKFKKLLSVILAVMMVMSVMPVGANTGMATGGTWPVIPEGATLIFAEDFESGFATDTNLLEADGTAEFTKDGKKTIAISQPSGTAVPAGYVAKVMAVDGFEGNALYLENSNQPAKADGTANNNATDNNLKFEVFFDDGAAVDLTSADSPYYGKQLVYEFDAKVSDLRERQFMKLNSSASGAGDAGQALSPFQKASGVNWALRQGPYKNFDSLTRPYMISQGIPMSNKTTLKVVFNQNGQLDSVRTYANGVLGVYDGSTLTGNVQGQYYAGKIVKDFVGEYFTNQTVADMTAPKSLLTYVCPNASKTAKVYIDNIVAYVVDPIEYEGFEKETDITPDEGLVVKFSEPFNADEDTFKVTTTADADIADAITEVTMAADKLSATVKLDFDVLEPLTSYKLWVDDEFASAAGATFYANPHGITAVDEWVELGTFTTCKKLALESVAPANVENYVQGENQEITLTFNDALALNEANLAAAFEVKDANEEVVTGLTAAYGATNNVVVLQLSGLTLGRGNHTIKSKANALYNAANTYADVEYTFGTLDFNAAAEETTFDYVPTTDKTVVVNLTVPTTLTNETIATGFVVMDASDNEVSGLTATLDGTGKVVTLQLSGLLGLATGTYTIDVTDALVDGANRTAMLDEEITFTVPAFEASISESNITMKPGATKNAEITLSVPTALTEAELYDAFVVEDAEGGVVTGLDIALDNTGKVITLYLQGINAPDGKYTIKSNANLVDEAGRNLAEAINIKLTIAEYVTLFEDDFETDYEVGRNWLTNNTSEAVVAPSGGSWVIDGGNNSASNFMGVVTKDDVTDKNGTKINYFDSNVLKIHAATEAGFTFWRKPAANVDLEAEGKMLIYEFDFYTTGAYKERKFMAIDASANNGFQRLSDINYYASTGPYYQAGHATYGAPEKGNWYARSTAQLSAKHNMKIIVDQTKDVDSIRTYIDGEVRSAQYNAVDNTYSNYGKTAYDFYGENYSGASTLNYGVFEGIYSAIGAASGTTIYLDNLKVYTVDTIEFDGVDWGTNSSTEFIPDKGLTVKFTEKITAEELKNNLIIKDANGNVVAGAVRSVELLADGKSALVKLDFSKLEKLTNYDIFLNFLFTSKQGAYIARDGVVDGGNVHIANITTGDKLEITVDNTAISGYDKGMDKTVTITLSSALKDGINPNDIFVVKDGAGNEIQGLAASISEDRKVITLQLSGLQLGDGVHTIESKQDALVNNAGIAGSVFITVNTLDFVAVPTPATGTILNYVQGTDEKVLVLLTTAADLESGDISDYFEVKDASGAAVEGIKATLAADKANIELDLSDLELGVGEHTIKVKDGILDSRGRTLEFEYEFTVMPFISNYTSVITGYVPGSEQVVEVKLTYPLNAASIANAANAFVVKNQYGSSVSGLTVVVSEDAKTIALDLSTLDITGGTYVIASKTGAFVNVKGEILADVVIDLSTSEDISEGTVTEDAGVGPNAGTDFEGDFISSVLLSENFDNEGYARNMNWLTSDSFVPARFVLDKVGKATDFVDASVSIVEDPVNPGNYVLKNVAGYKDATGTVIAGKENYHKVKRELDTGVTSIPVDDYTIVKLSTKVYIPTGGGAGVPTGDSGNTGDTKDTSTIIALTGSGTSSLNHSNIRQSGGSVQYNSYINASEAASGKAGSATALLSSDAWHTIELVFGYNDKSDGSKFKSYEVYVDGTKITACGGYFAKGSDYSTIGGMMSMLLSASGGSGTTTVYYDDWSVVKMDRLLTHINVPKEEVPETQLIKLQITGKLTEESVALIEEKGLVTLKDDEGNDVDATITIDNTGANTKIEIVPTYGLEYQRQFTVEIAENYVDDRDIVTPIYDELGNKFGGFTYSFETAKALNNTIDMDNGTLVYDADFMHNEDTFNYTMTLKNAVGTTPVIGAVATFSEDNKLLGIDYKVFNTGEISKDFTVSSELGAKSLKLFIWEQNSDGTMGRLMQIPDEVTSR